MIDYSHQIYLRFVHRMMKALWYLNPVKLTSTLHRKSDGSEVKWVWTITEMVFIVFGHVLLTGVAAFATTSYNFGTVMAFIWFLLLFFIRIDWTTSNTFNLSLKILHLAFFFGFAISYQNYTALIEILIKKLCL